jgi:hypothetical protein
MYVPAVDQLVVLIHPEAIIVPQVVPEKRMIVTGLVNQANLYA